MTQDIPRLSPQVNANGDLYATVHMGEGSKKNQCVLVIHKLMPVLFLPGVMGTHLKCIDIFRDKPEDIVREEEAEEEAKEAWRAPDSALAGIWLALKDIFWTAEERQKALHPDATFVDWDVPIPHLPQDMAYIWPAEGEETSCPPSKQQIEAEAKRRGWGTVHQDSYGSMLVYLEEYLNNLPSSGNGQEQALPEGLWAQIAKLIPSPPQTGNHAGTDEPMSEQECTEQFNGWLKKAGDYKFVVYACGYNWLRDNNESGNKYSRNSIEARENKKERATDLRSRLDAAIAECRRIDGSCDQAIVITHSLGGLVARAYTHQEAGSGEQKSKVLGIYHNVMPATGAPAFYKRIRAGFGGEMKGFWDLPTLAFATIAGGSAQRTSPVLLQAPGILELMPWSNYNQRKPWLGVCQKGNALSPEKWLLKLDTGHLNPMTGAWYELLPDAAHISGFKLTEGGYDPRLNPAQVQLPDDKHQDMERLIETMDIVKEFQRALANYYFPNSIMSYGNDPAQKSWGSIVWQGDIPEGVIGEMLKTARLVQDGYDGTVMIEVTLSSNTRRSFKLALSRAEQPGDGTVPMESGQAPAAFLPYFEEQGYDHQKSYGEGSSNRLAVLYAILRFTAQKSSGGRA